jgi:PAS domain S-box-containing protein
VSSGLKLSRVAALAMNRKVAHSLGELERANAALRAEIAERQRVEAELRASEERHRIFAENVPVVLFEVDTSGAVIYVSPSWARATGRPLADALGHGWTRFAHPEDHDRIMAIWAEAVASGEPRSAPYRYCTVNGQYRWVYSRVAPVRDDHGTVRRWIGSTTDIDHVVQAEQALRETETRFRATFENAAVGITNVTLDGRYLRVNDQFCAITGYAREELLTKTFVDITHPDDVERGVAAIRHMLAGEVTHFAREKRFIRKDGATVWVKVTNSVARKADGEPDYVISFTERIDERKRAEEALRDSEARLRLALAAGKMGFWQVDLQTGGAMIDPIEAGLLGLGESRQDFTHEKFLQLVHPDDREPLIQAAREAEQSGHEFQAEFRIRRANDGADRWLACAGAVARDARGRPARFLGVNFDITARKHAERAMLESNRRLELLSSSARALLASDDPVTFLDSLRKPLAELMGIDVYIHYELDGPKRLRLVGGHGISNKRAGSRRYLLIGEAVSGTVAAERKPILLEDVQGRSDEMTSTIRALGITAYLAHPLIASGRLIGTLSFGSRTRGRFEHDEVALIRSLSDQVAIAIERKYSEQALLNARDELEQRVHNRTQELERSREELRRLSHSLQAALEEERARIAREIHDELGSQLTAMKIELSMWADQLRASKRPPINKVERILASLDNSIQTIRRIASALRPSILDHMGLPTAIEWLANDFEQMSGLECRTKLDLPEGEPVLSAEQATSLFRIVQESLTNVARHARAHKIEITLKARPEHLAITIRDDGIGLAQEGLPATRSLGIIGMQERARAMGAKVHIYGIPRRGTTVEVDLPLVRRHEKQDSHSVR